MDNFNQQLFYVLTRARNVSDQQQRSKAASMTLSMKEWADRQRQDAQCAKTIKTIVRNSLAASYQANGINPAQLIHNFIGGFCHLFPNSSSLFCRCCQGFLSIPL